MFSLQASHLDFTLPGPRAALEAGLLDGLGADIWFSRPAFPTMEMAMDSLWGHLDRTARAKFPATIRGLTRRGLTAAIVSRSNLNSSQLAIEALTSAKAVAGLAMGACEIYFESLVVKLASNETQAVDLRDRSLWRRAPSHPDSDFCSACRSGAGNTRGVGPKRALRDSEFHSTLETVRALPRGTGASQRESASLARASDAPPVSSEPQAYEGGPLGHDESQDHFDRASELPRSRVVSMMQRSSTDEHTRSPQPTLRR